MTSILGDLSIRDNGALTTLTGLEGFISIGGSIMIDGEYSLTSLTGLENVTSIGRGFLIWDADALTSLTGLNSLTHIGEALDITQNDALTSLSGLGNVTFIKHLRIGGNNALTNLEGLENVTSIGGGGLIIELNDALTSLIGLENVTSITGNLWLFENSALTSLAGLENVTSIGGDLWLWKNDALTSLTGLENVTSVGDDLWFEENSALTSLTGIENIDAGSISALTINYKDSLSTCEVKSICDYLISPNGTIDIHDNATGCNSQAEVEAACEALAVNNKTNDNACSVYPNPACTEVTIESTTKGQLSILNLSGQQLITRQITEHKTQLDISALPVGVYFVMIMDEKKIVVREILKY
jgi:hypothetical protein